MLYLEHSSFVLVFTHSGADLGILDLTPVAYSVQHPGEISLGIIMEPLLVSFLIAMLNTYQQIMTYPLILILDNT